MDYSTPGSSVLYLLELAQAHVHGVSDAFQPSHPLPPSYPFVFNLSQHQGLFHESALHIGWPKYWSFSFIINPSNEYSELISFRIDWLGLLAVQRVSQESSPAPQFKSISSLVLSLLYGPILISVCDYWKIVLCLSEIQSSIGHPIFSCQN